MIIDRKYLTEMGIKDEQKQSNFHSRFLKWHEQAMIIKINNTIDAIEHIDKIKKMYDWVECESFMYYYKHLNQEPSPFAVVSGCEMYIVYIRLKDMSCIDGSKLFSSTKAALKWCDENPLYPADDYEYLIARTEYVR